MRYLLVVVLMSVLGTAFAEDGFEATVWVDKYRVNEVTPNAFVPIEVKFNFDKKSNVETIYQDDLTKFGVKLKVVSVDDDFVTYDWDLYQMKKDKWQKVNIEKDLVETMFGASKLVEQNITLPTKEKQVVSIQYLISLSKA